jgi:hypothetical protein
MTTIPHDDQCDQLLLSPIGNCKKGHAFAPHNHKYARKLGLLHLHELWVDNLAGNLVWIQGPYPAG